MRINLSAARFTATFGVRKSDENDMLAAERDEDKSSVGEPFPSVLPILKSVAR